MACVGGRVSDKDCTANDEGQPDCEGAFPAGLQFVGDGGVEDCAEDGGCVDACWVVVLLDGCVAARGHPEGHYVVA